MAEECSSSSEIVPGVLLAVVGCLRWVGVQEEVVGHLAEEAVEVEEAPCHLEVVEGAETCLQLLARVEETQGRQEGRGVEEGRQEQQLPVSAGTQTI